MAHPARAGEAPHGQRAVVTGCESVRCRCQPICRPGFSRASRTASSVPGWPIISAAPVSRPGGVRVQDGVVDRRAHAEVVGDKNNLLGHEQKFRHKVPAFHVPANPHYRRDGIHRTRR